MRALLPDLAPLRFQHLMRMLHNDYFARLDPTGAGRCTTVHWCNSLYKYSRSRTIRNSRGNSVTRSGNTHSRVFVACSEADVGLVLALLVAVTNGDAMERADAAHAVLKWRSGARGVTQATATLYIAALKVL